MKEMEQTIVNSNIIVRAIKIRDARSAALGPKVPSWPIYKGRTPWYGKKKCGT